MINFLPFLTAAFSLFFLIQLLIDYFRHGKSEAHHIWWAIGVFCVGFGTFMTGFCDLVGYSEVSAKLAYISGPVLAAFPFAQGFVFLLASPRFAKISSFIFVPLLIIIVTAIVLSPFEYPANAEKRLIGQAIEWTWIRHLTRIVNVWALLFFFGGALYAAFKITDANFGDNRFNGYLCMAVGAFLPAIDGYLAHAGFVILLSVSEFIGILLIYLGYVALNMDSEGA